MGQPMRSAPHGLVSKRSLKECSRNGALGFLNGFSGQEASLNRGLEGFYKRALGFRGVWDQGQGNVGA